MANSSNIQTDFQGGIWSEMAQGRMDDPLYKIAMNESLNGYPTEEKAWIRRPGFRAGDYTRNGKPARIRAMSVFDAYDYTIEITDGHLRFWAGQKLATYADAVTVSSISAAQPAAVATAVNDFATGDQVIFTMTTPATNPELTALLFDRCFSIVVSDNQHFTITDPVTGVAFDGSQVTLGSNVLSVSKVVDIATPWATQAVWSKVNIAEKAGTVYFFHPNYQTRTLNASVDGVSLVWLFSTFIFSNGPFMDAQSGLGIAPDQLGSVQVTGQGPPLIPDQLGPHINLEFDIRAYSSLTIYAKDAMVTFGGGTYVSLQKQNENNQPNISPTFWASTIRGHFINNGAGFLATDVGRQIRLWSEPAYWDATLAYAVDQIVSYGGTAWISQGTIAGQKPGDSASTWIVGSGLQMQWRWGHITAVNNFPTYDVHVVLGGVSPNIPGGTTIAPLLYLAPIWRWQLGLFSESDGATNSGPSAGGFHEGRLYIAAGASNFQASEPGSPTYFLPTQATGQVIDSNALNLTVDGPSFSPFLWFQSTTQGLLMGTKDGEWKLEASDLNNPITPTSVQAHLESKFGSAPLPPVMAGVVPIFLHRNGQLLYESLRDTYSGQMIALSLSDSAKHLTAKGIVDFAYTRGTSPILWAVIADGTLVGTTYRRDKLRMFTIEPPLFNGWHRHIHGAGDREFISVAPYKSIHSNGDGLCVITEQVSTGLCRVEFMMDQMLQTDDIYHCNFLDGIYAPTDGAFTGVDGHEVTIPDVPGYWSVPGFHIVTQCDGTVQSEPAGTVFDSIKANLFELTNPPGPSTFQGINFPAGLTIWTSPPADGGGGGCGFFAFTANGQWAGEVGASLPPPASPDHFTIFQLAGDFSFGTTKWFPYQFWKRNDGDSTSTPAQPTWHDAVPGGTHLVDVGKATGVSLHGLSNLNNTLITAFIAGIDCGEFPVIDGKIEVPFGCVPEFTYERIQRVDAMKRDWRDLAISFHGFTVPALVGYKYDSRGQRVRPIAPPDTGAQAGPGFGKKKRTHKYAILLQRSRGFYIGTDFSRMFPATLRTDGGTPIPDTSLYSGLHKDTLADDSTLDSMIAWEAKDCWPLNVCAVGGFIETQDE